MSTLTITRKRCNNLTCDGEWIATGNSSWTGNGSSYEHRCTKCDMSVWVGRKYPSTEVTHDVIINNWE